MMSGFAFKGVYESEDTKVYQLTLLSFLFFSSPLLLYLVLRVAALVVSLRCSSTHL